jgi:hypothetical protein
MLGALKAVPNFFATFWLLSKFETLQIPWLILNCTAAAAAAAAAAAINMDFRSTALKIQLSIY